MTISLYKLLRDPPSGRQLAERVQEYDEFFSGDDCGREKREKDYRRFITLYYDLVADFYEWGWGPSHHFALHSVNESFADSLVRHEHYLANVLNLRPAMRVADIGCGLGGPLREIARYSGASVVGININEYQVERARRYSEEAGQSHLEEFVVGDFMDMDVPDGSFDAVYSVEATPCAPEKPGAFREIFRVLKPGSCFAGYEYCLTDLFDHDNHRHLQIKKNIEIGAGMVNVATPEEINDALGEVGFEILETRDLASQTVPNIPWYEPLSGSGISLARFRSSQLGRLLIQKMLQLLTLIGVARRGTTDVNRVLNLAADGLVEAGRLRIFTPMYFVLARKPESIKQECLEDQD